MIIGGWVALLSIAVAAGLTSSDRHNAYSATTSATIPEAFLPADYADSSGNATSISEPVKFTLKKELQNSLPHSFRNTQPNVITHAEWLAPVARILQEGKRPLRVVQIGDSHVAGKSFPQSLRQTLGDYLGLAELPDSGVGVYFNFFGRNGATGSHFLSDSYMQKFAEKRPDLIVLSLGTNEAHGMGYREDQRRNTTECFFQPASRGLSRCGNFVNYTAGRLSEFVVCELSAHLPFKTETSSGALCETPQSDEFALCRPDSTLWSRTPNARVEPV